MTITEASEQYNIPLSILREYESWGLCDTVKTVMGAWQYDEEDIERLSMIMTLHDIGFEHDEIASYMRLRLQGAAAGPAGLPSPSDSETIRLRKKFLT